MKDFALSADRHDRFLINGDLAFVGEAMEVAQNTKIRILTIEGEEAFNFTLGLPWITLMFDPTVPQSYKERLIRREIMKTEGFRTLLEFSFVVKDRKANVKYAANTIYGIIKDEIDYENR